MTTDRIKEIQDKTAYPDSISVQQALLKVWNETEQEQLHIGGVSQQRELFFSLMEFMKSQSRVSMMSHGMHEELWNEFKEKHSG
jgi:hypothetical protein